MMTKTHWHSVLLHKSTGYTLRWYRGLQPAGFEFSMAPPALTKSFCLLRECKSTSTGHMLMPTSTSQANSRSSRLPFSILIVLSTLFWAVAAALAADQPLAPLPYAASYEARAMGMRTSAYRTLELADNNRFRLNHGLSVTALGANLITVNESTEFVWQAQGAVPLQYHYQQSGVRRRDEQVAFDWQQLSAAMNRDGREQTQTLESGMQDNLSFSAQMSADLLNQPDLRTTDTLLTYQILDARRLEHHEYRVAGEERISTAAGELDTIKLERVRDSDSGRSTVVWLSTQHQFILAKLLQVESNGSEMELTLESIEWTGSSSAP
jgi:hypothetical protein